jgi:NAD(P)-dependent dehydrogenase (short-subunit alcohol dehydrogenase family)
MAAKWTPDDIPDQSGRSAVVTGANSGIGAVAARELAAHGARVVLAVRSVEKGDAAAAGMTGDVEVRRLDLADLSSVRAFAEAFDRDLDLLVNNAGVMALPHRTTVDGFEMQIGTNHLGHFALTGLLLPRLMATATPRVVTVASGAHRMGRIDFHDLHSERKRYRKWNAYGQSKLANLLFAYELQRRAETEGVGLRSVAAHPGWSATNLQFAGPEMAGSRLEHRGAALMNRIIAQDDEHGAWPTLYAATTVALPGGSYVGPDGFMELHGHPKVVTSSGRSKDRDAAARLWALSEDLTGVHYPFAAPAPAG